MDLSRFKQGGGEFESAPAGVYNAVCIAVIDLGTQTQTKYQSQETEEVPLVELRWEIDEMMPDGKKRFMVMKRYRQSMHEKASLRKHLEAWRGAAFKDSEFAPGGFSMEKLLGQGCQIQLGPNEKGNIGLVGIMKLAKGMKPLKPDIEPFIIDLESPATFDADAFAALSENMKQTIAKSPEFQAIIDAKQAAKKTNGAKPARVSTQTPAIEHTEELDDEIPF